MSKEKKNCFFITPIGEIGTPIRKRSDWILNGILKPALDDNFDVIRADKISSNGLITQEIIKHCLEAELIIADLSDGNPNVYYELAIADMQATPVITILENGQFLPFDMKDKRTIYYDISDWENVESVKKQIQHMANDSLEKGYKVSNPIKATRALIKLDSSADPKEKVISDLYRKIEMLEIRQNITEQEKRPIQGLFGFGNSNNEFNNSLGAYTTKGLSPFPDSSLKRYSVAEAIKDAEREMEKSKQNRFSEAIAAAIMETEKSNEYSKTMEEAKKVLERYNQNNVSSARMAANELEKSKK